MRILLMVVLVFFVFTNKMLAQDGEKMPAKAQKLFEKAQLQANWQQYQAARETLEKTVKKYPRFTQAFRRLAEICWQLKDYDAAENAYAKMADLKNTPFNRYMVQNNLGRMAMEQQKFGKAVVAFEKALSIEGLPGRLSTDTMQIGDKLRRCRFIQHALEHPVAFQPILLDTTINTYRDEYLPMLTADERVMVFTRRLSESRAANEDFYMSRNMDNDSTSAWSIAIPLESPINTQFNEGAICISPDGAKLFFAAKDRNDTEGGFDLYYCIKRGDKWSIPFNLGRPINGRYWESQPCISADGKSLYFASRRGGGYGGIDLWVSHLANDNYWGEPVNLGPNINTTSDEQTPFIHPDGHTLYFSSNGHIGMGDADLFVARIDTADKWGKPQNLGYPINTFGNEGGLVVTAKGDRAYFAARNDSMGLDIYYFDLPKYAQAETVTYVKGRVFDANKPKEGLSAYIDLVDLDSGKTIMRALSDELSGEFLVTLPTGRNYLYNVSKQGYLFHSENFALKQSTRADKPYRLDIALQPIQTPIAKTNDKNNPNKNANENTAPQAGQRVVLKNVFFETNSYELKPESFMELDRLVQLLQENTQLQIEIGGHTDSTGTDELNLKLSENRAKTVHDYLAQKVTNSQKRLSYKGYGSTQAIANNQTPEGRAINRRTEFKVIQKM